MKEFEENIVALRKLFDSNADYDSTGRRFIYCLSVNDLVTVQVNLIVGREEFNYLPKNKMKAACWVVAFFNKESMTVDTIEVRGESNLFKFFNKHKNTFTELDRDDLEDIALFMEVIWSEIFMKRVRQYGLITGSWMAGALLV